MRTFDRWTTRLSMEVEHGSIQFLFDWSVALNGMSGCSSEDRNLFKVVWLTIISERNQLLVCVTGANDYLAVLPGGFIWNSEVVMTATLKCEVMGIQNK